MNKIYSLGLGVLTLAAAFVQEAKAQVTNINATVNILAGTTVVCIPPTPTSMSWDNQASGIVLINTTSLAPTATLEVRGHVRNNGSFTGNPNSVLLATGTSEQLFDGASTINLANFTVNNTSGTGVTLGNTGATGAVRLSNILTLTTGNVYANNVSPIVFTNTALNPTETNATRIIGTAKLEPRVVGAAAFPTFLNCSMAAGTNLGTMVLERRTGSGAGNTLAPAPTPGFVTVNGNTSIACHWTITYTNWFGNEPRDVTFSWLSANDNGKDVTNLQLWRTITSPYGITSPWRDMCPLTDISARTWTQSSGQYLYNSWTFSDMINPLPLELLSFNLVKVEKNAHVMWSTVKEINTDYFEVERSLDNQNFVSIGKVKAAGNSSSVRDYTFDDPELYNLGSNVVYYRIKQFDFDGKSQVYKSKALNLEGMDETVVNVYPNPFADELHINIFNPNEELIQLQLTDNLGKPVYNLSEKTKLFTHTISSELQNLPAGSYVLNVRTATTNQNYKLVKIR